MKIVLSFSILIAKRLSVRLLIVQCGQLVFVCMCIYIQEIKNIKNVKRCRDGMPKSMQTR